MTGWHHAREVRIPPRRRQRERARQRRSLALVYPGGIAVLDVIVLGEVDGLLGAIVEAHAHGMLAEFEHRGEGAVLH